MNRHLSSRMAILIVTVLVATTVSAGSQGVPAQQESSLLGRLATVEPKARRLTVVAEGEILLTEVIVDAEGQVRQGEDEISLSDLVGLVGSRVTVLYRLENGVKIARTVTVEEGSLPPLPPLARATAPNPPPA